LGSCNRLSVSEDTSWELGVLVDALPGVPVGVDRPLWGVLQPVAAAWWDGDGV